MQNKTHAVFGRGDLQVDSRFSILASKPAACRLEICLTERNVAMREIKGEAITQAVARLCMSANRNLPQDVRTCITQSQERESWEPARGILSKIVENYKIAEEDQLPICQDTGVACVFLEVGQEVHIQGDLEQAVNAGVHQGYLEAGLRCSVVADPLRRVNTKDNTPAVLYIRLVPGDRLKITVAPKGAGSENMSRIAMLRPSDGAQGVKDFVFKTVAEAGPNPCPPIVVGVGIGGGFDRSAELAKRALLRPAGSPNPFYAEMEQELLERINALGIGPQGLGGRTTALAVHIEVAAVHMASLPVAVNINCHVTRHESEVL